MKPSEPETTIPPTRRPWINGMPVIILAIMLILTGTGFATWMVLFDTAEHLTDLDGRIVIPDDPTATDPRFLEQAGMVLDDGGDGFVIPVLNLDVPLGSVNEVGGVMNPANFTNVFTIRNRGVPPSRAGQGTVYMVTHAIAGGNAPGNQLQTNGQVVLTPGDVIKADGVEFRFQTAVTVHKDDLNGLADLWDQFIPRRLVLITCVVNANGGQATHNMVIVATLSNSGTDTHASVTPTPTVAPEPEATPS